MLEHPKFQARLTDEILAVPMEVVLRTTVDKMLPAIYDVFRGDCSGHGFSHITRVFVNAMKIQKKEGGNAMVVGPAALVHDFHRARIFNHSNPNFGASESTPMVHEFLKRFEFPEKYIQPVLTCVAKHDDKNFVLNDQPVGLEIAIVRDADIIDGIGIEGILRQAAYMRSYGISAEEAFKFTSDEILNLKNRLQTQTAMIMSEERQKYMEKTIKHGIKIFELLNY